MLWPLTRDVDARRSHPATDRHRLRVSTAGPLGRRSPRSLCCRWPTSSTSTTASDSTSSCFPSSRWASPSSWRGSGSPTRRQGERWPSSSSARAWRRARRVPRSLVRERVRHPSDGAIVMRAVARRSANERSHARVRSEPATRRALVHRALAAELQSVPRSRSSWRATSGARTRTSSVACLVAS